MSNDTEESLETLLPSLGTGDLVFFQGTGEDSVLIRQLTGGEWSHCAMVIKAADIGLHGDGLLLLESTVVPGEDIAYKDSDDGKTVGVMLVDFVARMRSYADSGDYSAFGLRKLRTATSEKIDSESVKNFVENANVRRSVYPPQHAVAAEHFLAKELESEAFTGRAVSKVQKELGDDIANKLSESEIKAIVNKTIESVRDGFEEPVKDKINRNYSAPSHFFCSELVVDALMHSGLMGIGNAAAYSPSDLSDDSNDQLAAAYEQLINIPSDLGLSQD